MDREKDAMLILEAYPGEGAWMHYQDNGEDFAYQQGAYNEYRITNQNGEVQIEFVHKGYPEYGKVEIRSGEKLWSR